MVQVISVDKLTPQKLDKVDSKDMKLSNTDFLELLLKDMKDETLSKDDKDALMKKLESTKDNDTLDEKKSELDSKFDLKLEPKLQFSKQDIEEVKNIMTSKFKQDNIILSKQDVKDFKNMDNLKDLINFADKKGLNIEKLKVDIQKEVRPDLKDLFNKKSDKKSTIDNLLNKPSTKETLQAKSKPDTKQKNISLENIIKSDTSKNKEIKTKQTDSKTISLEKLLAKNNSKDNIDTNKKIDKKTDKKVDLDSKHLNKIKPSTLKSSNNIQFNENIVVENKTTTKKVNLESLLDKKVGTDKSTDKNVKIDSLESLLNPKDKIETKKVQTKDSLDVNINQQNMVNELKAKGVQAKETINHFKNNLDEAIKNYKPPVSKVDIELNPKNLGKVEVSIIQRGNNIHINMNTDQSNVAMFQTHQAEFRQALSSIGFSNIDMSFNSNQDRDRKQNQAKKTYESNEKIEDIGDIEIKADYKYA